MTIPAERAAYGAALLGSASHSPHESQGELHDHGEGQHRHDGEDDGCAAAGWIRCTREQGLYVRSSTMAGHSYEAQQEYAAAAGLRIGRLLVDEGWEAMREQLSVAVADDSWFAAILARDSELTTIFDAERREAEADAVCRAENRDEILDEMLAVDELGV